jgi:predicted O-methyltransferase YrrM
MITKINGFDYIVNNNEFEKYNHEQFTNLHLKKDVGLLERIVSLINECSILNLKTLVIYNTQFGGFIPINCSQNYENIILLETENIHKDNILANIQKSKINNIKLVDNFDNLNNSDIFIFSNDEILNIDYIIENKPFLLTKNNETLQKTYIYNKILKLTNSEFYLYIPDSFIEVFDKEFYYFINERGELDYDNLIHLCVMVKNAGPQFESMLNKNLSIIDRWTILDTGSTDETIDIINRVLVGKKKGELYQEPFINFRDSRNRCLELAGTPCKFILTLDDTYVVKGNLRDFLNEIRGDQFSDSFTLFIESDDTKYGSNRIIKSKSGLRYKHKIHEVICDKNNKNVVIPENHAYIFDYRYDYLAKRTMERKHLDLKLLFEEIEEDPHDPRAYYYLAQTYNILEDYEKAFFYFNKRCEIINTGFLQERVDAAFERARIANFKLNKPWTECEKLYLNCYNIDVSRPEALYFIGAHYYLENNYEEAFPYLKKAFEIGFPTHCQYSLKPTLSYYFLPKLLTKVSYYLKEYEIGEAVAKFFILNNKPEAEDYSEIVSWYNIFVKLNHYKGPKTVKMNNKPILCFVADGGFNPWTGSTILTSGVGGSETYIIEMARHIQQTGNFEVYVFCNTPKEEKEIFEGVNYCHLNKYYEFINTTYVHTCIVSRFSEYLPVTFKGYTENVYLVVHDLTPSGIVIPIDNKLKNIFCLTEWHANYLGNIFPSLKNIIVPFYYGIDDRFKNNNSNNKIKNKFIYSSFPNRGLLQLLQMWPKIYEKEPSATLYIYADVNNKWSNDVEPAKMNEIKKLLQEYKKRNNGLGIHYCGWVGKKELAEAWLSSDFWFYPCTFMETFCLTALEAASSKTLAITNDLAALQNTVGSRGVVINGDATTYKWQNEALKQIFYYMDEKNIYKKEHLININYKWSSGLSWSEQANILLNKYILPNGILQYKGMYNWTNDLPYGSKETFLNIINYFNNNYYKIKTKEKINVLEIGTYTGISLINIIKAIPNSIGIGIDMWKNYDENEVLQNIDNLNVETSFYHNINVCGLKDKISGIKSSSSDKLVEFIKNNVKMDFIYIDGSHLLLDCYADLILSWQILEKEGILVIDDYLYKKKKTLDSPYEAVNHFLKNYEGKYKLLDKNYRVFLQKL